MSTSFQDVQVTGLVKMYGPTRALSGLSAQFQAGQITAVEGPNGSGKSTLLSLLSLLARPTRGQIRFGRWDPYKRSSLRRAIGVLAHAPMLYPDLSGLENLQLSARLYRLSEPAARVSEMAERFELGRYASRPVRTYSRGQLQRVSLARAVLHRPQLLLLDEPSTGLDRVSTGRLVDAVIAERTRGAIVVMVTHDSELSERLADARLVLARGRLAQPSAERAGAQPSAERAGAQPSAERAATEPLASSDPREDA